jgi:hypothetical protein
LALKPVLEELKEKFQAITAEKSLGDEIIRVKIGTLSAEQAIGNPARQDYPLLEGKEVMIEAEFQGSFGQAFTDRPHDFDGSLNDILNLSLDTSENRAIFIAALNAVTAHLGMAAGTRHCHDEEPEKCAEEMAEYLLTGFGGIKVGLAGLQPAILDNLVKTFGADNVKCTDLNPNNVGSLKYGAEIWNGRTETEKLIEWSDLFLVTSSTIVNDTFDDIREGVISRGKPLIIFGVTGAGAAALLDVARLCFQPH